MDDGVAEEESDVQSSPMPHPPSPAPPPFSLDDEDLGRYAESCLYIILDGSIDDSLLLSLLLLLVVACKDTIGGHDDFGDG